MKNLIVSVITILAAGWLLVACSGSSNNNPSSTCGAYSSAYPYTAYNPAVSPQNGYNTGIYNPALSPYYGNTGYNNTGYNPALTNPCLSGLSPYANPAGGAYPYNGLYNGACGTGNVLPIYSIGAGSSYCAPNSFYSNPYMAYAQPMTYQGYFWWVIP